MNFKYEWKYIIASRNTKREVWNLQMPRQFVKRQKPSEKKCLHSRIFPRSALFQSIIQNWKTREIRTWIFNIKDLSRRCAQIYNMCKKNYFLPRSGPTAVNLPRHGITNQDRFFSAVARELSRRVARVIKILEHRQNSIIAYTNKLKICRKRCARGSMYPLYFLWKSNSYKCFFLQQFAILGRPRGGW